MTSKADFAIASGDDCKRLTVANFHEDYSALVTYCVNHRAEQPELYDVVSTMVRPYYDFQMGMTKDLNLDLPVGLKTMKKLPLIDNIERLKNVMNGLDKALMLESAMPADLYARLSGYVAMRVVSKPEVQVVASKREPSFA